MLSDGFYGVNQNDLCLNEVKRKILLFVTIYCVSFVLTQIFLSKLKPKARLEPFEGLYNAIYVCVCVCTHTHIYMML